MRDVKWCKFIKTICALLCWPGLFFVRAVFGAKALDFIYRKFVVATKSFCQLVFSAEVDFTVSDPLDVKEMAGGDIVGCEVFAA